MSSKRVVKGGKEGWRAGGGGERGRDGEKRETGKGNERKRERG